MGQDDLSLDLLLQETLAMTEYLRSESKNFNRSELELDKHFQTSFLSADSIEKNENENEEDIDYLFDLADDVIQEKTKSDKIDQLCAQGENTAAIYPEKSGIIYKIDSNNSTFCVRGFPVSNIRETFIELENKESTKRSLLKLDRDSILSCVSYFETPSFELAEALREQIINRRFPHEEDVVCNISDPGFSWWMNVDNQNEEGHLLGKFEIFFRSHGINRAEKYIQLGPIGDGAVAALRLNQARTLLRSSFPISEFSCDEKSFIVSSAKPEHLGFISFRNIFLLGENHTTLENFPDNSLGRTLYYYFHELAIVRKFWIEVKSKLS